MYYYARIVDNRYADGHHFQSINVGYTPGYNVTLHFVDEVLKRVNGTAFDRPLFVKRVLI